MIDRAVDWVNVNHPDLEAKVREAAADLALLDEQEIRPPRL